MLSGIAMLLVLGASLRLIVGGLLPQRQHCCGSSVHFGSHRHGSSLLKLGLLAGTVGIPFLQSRLPWLFAGAVLGIGSVVVVLVGLRLLRRLVGSR